MGIIYDLVKSNDLFTIEEQQSVCDAARAMSEHGVGAVPVLNQGVLTGIFSERDIMNRVVAPGLDPKQTRVAEVMSKDVLTVPPGESVESCMVMMKTHSIRHLPIVDGSELIGIISLRDILLHEVSEMDGEVRAMRAYMQTGM